MILAGVALAGCGADAVGTVAGPDDLGHIHDLVETANGKLLAASHLGLYRIVDTDTAVLIGSERHDLMSMAEDDGTLYASGHPDLRLERYLVDGLPPHLGLATSRDGGVTWSVDADLLGRSDFHALVPTAGGLFAADTSGVIRFLDSAGVWTELGEVTARDLAVDPNDAYRLAATDEEGLVWVSDDGAATWAPVPGAPSAIEIEWTTSDGLITAAADGRLHQADEPGGPWATVGAAPGEIETLHIDDGRWWVTGHGGAIHVTTDRAVTWDVVYLPPTP